MKKIEKWPVPSCRLMHEVENQHQEEAARHGEDEEGRQSREVPAPGSRAGDIGTLLAVGCSSCSLC